MDDLLLQILLLIKEQGGEATMNDDTAEQFSVTPNELSSACAQLYADGYLSKMNRYLGGTFYVELSYKGYQVANAPINPVSDVEEVENSYPIKNPGRIRFANFKEKLLHAVTLTALFKLNLIYSLKKIWLSGTAKRLLNLRACPIVGSLRPCSQLSTVWIVVSISLATSA